ncbi:MAG TPA: FG-GAP-like repeat-containing protein [Polyangiaceae bacterium]|nr:FG-GAP-like repeat-containing protein [Polyangiaceae bacterium]
MIEHRCTCTAGSCPSGQTCKLGQCVDASPGTFPLASPVQWSLAPYSGTVGTYFADVNGDGKADAIAVSASGTTIALARDGAFQSGLWKDTAAFSDAISLDFADVTGDRCADMIIVKASGNVVRRSNCVDRFGVPQLGGTTDEPWTTDAFYGNVQTNFADVTGDGCADAVAITNLAVVVRRSVPCASSGTLTGHFGPSENWTDREYLANIAILVADVTGDGRADAIVVNTRNPGIDNGVTVRRSDGSRFLPNEHWTNGEVFYGDIATLTGDVTGDGMADLIAVDHDGVRMRRSNRWALAQPERLSPVPVQPSTIIPGAMFAVTEVTGDGRADLLQVSDDAIWVRARQDRQVDIRFVQLVRDAADARSVVELQRIVDVATAVYRPAGVSFHLNDPVVVAGTALADLTGPQPATLAELSAVRDAVSPECDFGTDLESLSKLAQMSGLATRCAPDRQITVFVTHSTRSSDSVAQLPWEGRAFFLDPVHVTQNNPTNMRLAHEIGHYLGLLHTFGCCTSSAGLSHSDLAASNLKDPEFGTGGSLALFWDLVYGSGASTKTFFDSRSTAEPFVDTLRPIQASNTSGDLTAGWFCPSGKPNKACPPSAPAGLICIKIQDSNTGPTDYCSGSPALQGLGLRLRDDRPTFNVMSFGYAAPNPDPLDIQQRPPSISLSQVEQIARVLTFDIDTLVLDASGQVIRGGRPRLGL